VEFQAADKSAGFFGAVLCDKSPNLLDIALGRAGDSNADFTGTRAYFCGRQA
jgi:hypothetical protein